jgi:hypothetical protein
VEAADQQRRQPDTQQPLAAHARAFSPPPSTPAGAYGSGSRASAVQPIMEMRG